MTDYDLDYVEERASGYRWPVKWPVIVAMVALLFSVLGAATYLVVTVP